MKTKLVCGVGICNKGKYPAFVFRKSTKEYSLWNSMLNRCYNPNTHKKFPTYKDCTVSENFRDFQFFAEWCNNQIGFGIDGWCLDKDILVKGNKIYSEDTCCFVPRKLNNIFLDCGARKGEYPTGVSFHKNKNKFGASCRVNGVLKTLGYFETPEEAYLCYRLFKEAYVSSVVETYRDVLDGKTYEALKCYYSGQIVNATSLQVEKEL